MPFPPYDTPPPPLALKNEAPTPLKSKARLPGNDSLKKKPKKLETVIKKFCKQTC